MANRKLALRGYVYEPDLKFEFAPLLIAYPALDVDDESLFAISKALHFYWSRRQNPITLAAIARQISTLKKAGRRVRSSIEGLSNALSDLDLDTVAPGTGTPAKEIETVLAFCERVSRLKGVGSGAHVRDAAALALVWDLKKPFLTLTGRRPTRSFNQRKMAHDQDVSANPFGRFVEIVEEVAIQAARAKRIPVAKLAIPNKRTIIEAAVDRQFRPKALWENDAETRSN